VKSTAISLKPAAPAWPLAYEELRPLTFDEIDCVAGGILAIANAGGYALGSTSTYTSAKTLTYTNVMGSNPFSVASIGFAYASSTAFATGVGPGAFASTAASAETMVTF
jgi:hypothetical protein